MTVDVISAREIILNSVRYPLIGKIRPTLVSIFPQKMVTGAYDKLSDLYKDSWNILGDQRGGILVEEMDERTQANRSWWSTANIDFRGHTILPRLATDCGAGGLSSKDGYVLFEWDGAVYVALDEFLRVFDNTNDDFNDTVLTLASNPTDAREMIKTIFVACDDNGYYYNPKLWVPQQLTDGGFEIWTNSTTLTHWTETGTGTLTREDSIVEEGLYSAKLETTGSGTLILTRTVSNFSPDWRGKRFKWTIRVRTNDTSQTIIRLDDGVGTTDVSPTGTGSFETVTCERTLDANATKLDFVIRNIYISGGVTVYVDNSDLAYTETSSPWITKSTISAKYFVEWDDKQFKINGENILSQATDNTTWTNKGQIPIDDDSVTRLYVDKDANGDDIIYAATTQGLWAHDAGSSKWVLTQLQTPDHPNSGKGAAVWRDAAYISAGLDVLKYEVDTPARITSMGLDRDDGLPSEQDGEIMMIVPGYNEFYACLDASEASGTSYSSLMAYDGQGWRVKWESTTADKAFKCALVTSAYSEYRIFWATDNKVYHMDLNRSLRNPLKISGDTFDTGAMYISPWFDADWQVGNKLALKHELFASEDVSADETIIVKYRLDHSNTTRDNGWTTAQTITSSGLSTYTFGSSLGTAFKAIQFRYDLARAAGSTTETPDILYSILYYKKILPKKWGYRMTLDLTQSYHGVPSKTLLSNLTTAAELGTMMSLVYRDTTKYVEVREVQGNEFTGQDNRGTYDVFLIEL